MFDSRMFFVFVVVHLVLFAGGTILAWEGLKWGFHWLIG